MHACTHPPILLACTHPLILLACTHPLILLACTHPPILLACTHPLILLDARDQLTLSESAWIADILPAVATPPVPPHSPCLGLLDVPPSLLTTPALRHASSKGVPQFRDRFLPVGDGEQNADDNNQDDDPEGDVPVALQPRQDVVQGLLCEDAPQDVQKVIVININTTAWMDRSHFVTMETCSALQELKCYSTPAAMACPPPSSQQCGTAPPYTGGAPGAESAQ